MHMYMYMCMCMCMSEMYADLTILTITSVEESTNHQHQLSSSGEASHVMTAALPRSLYRSNLRVDGSSSRISLTDGCTAGCRLSRCGGLAQTHLHES